ncbi:hypothetical protein, partial [Frankia sp. CcWB3]
MATTVRRLVTTVVPGEEHRQRMSWCPLVGLPGYPALSGFPVSRIVGLPECQIAGRVAGLSGAGITNGPSHPSGP